MTGNGAEVPCKLRKITKLKNIGTTIWYNNYDILTDTIRFEYSNDRMRKEYDFTKSVKNPYAKKLKKQITILLENETVDYFKKLAAETDIPIRS